MKRAVLALLFALSLPAHAATVNLYLCEGRVGGYGLRVDRTDPVLEPGARQLLRMRLVAYYRIWSRTQDVTSLDPIVVHGHLSTIFQMSGLSLERIDDNIPADDQVCITLDKFLMQDREAS